MQISQVLRHKGREVATIDGAENVRTALQFVARGEAPLGVVYETDARLEPRVRVVGIFPASSHPSIRYPAAMVVGGQANAATFLVWLQGREARSVFARHGFSRPDR